MASLTVSAGVCIFGAELSTSLKAEPAPNGGFFVPSLWREAGSGNAPACPLAGATSRRQGGLAAILAACRNALKEAAMTMSATNLLNWIIDHMDLIQEGPEVSVAVVQMDPTVMDELIHFDAERHDDEDGEGGV